MTLPPHMVTNLSRFIWELLGFTLEVPYPRKFCSATPFPGGSDSKASAYNAGDLGSISVSGRFPGEGYGNPLQYSCLENPMDGGAWQTTVHGVTKSWPQLSDFTFTFLTHSRCGWQPQQRSGQCPGMSEARSEACSALSLKSKQKSLFNFPNSLLQTCVQETLWH